MECKQVWGVYWSATGNTRRVVERLAAGLADGLGQSCRMVDLTPQNARAQPRRFRAGDLVVVGLPTYAGKLPNKILPDVQTKLQGGGALAVGVVTFGNRSFDNALAELGVTLETDGFHAVAAAAFSRSLGRAVSLSVSSFRDRGRAAIRSRALSRTRPCRAAALRRSSSSGDSSIPAYRPKAATSLEPRRRIAPSSRKASQRSQTR